ncbi:MAG: hypothetical protein JEY91_17525 [Spirochaetaceae bacterium]|nr:hypothetical protein [Spirochaetaceae bacterium]
MKYDNLKNNIQKNNYIQKHHCLEKTEILLKEFNYDLDEIEREELIFIKKLDKINKKILSDTKSS